MLARISDIELFEATSCEVINFAIIRYYEWYFITDDDSTWLKRFTWWVNKPVILPDTWCEALNLSLGRWYICQGGVLVSVTCSEHISGEWGVYWGMLLVWLWSSILHRMLWHVMDTLAVPWWPAITWYGIHVGS